MKITQLTHHPREGHFTIHLDCGSEWELTDVGDGIYYIDCHVTGPDDMDEWREQAKAMIFFADLVDHLIEVVGELEIDNEAYHSEQELEVTAHLSQHQMDTLVERYSHER